jgi:hypothetical protein
MTGVARARGVVGYFLATQAGLLLSYRREHVVVAGRNDRLPESSRASGCLRSGWPGYACRSFGGVIAAGGMR